MIVETSAYEVNWRTNAVDRSSFFADEAAARLFGQWMTAAAGTVRVAILIDGVETVLKPKGDRP